MSYLSYLTVIVVTVTLTLLATATPTPTCYEDEVIVWTGTAHTKCVPIDLLDV